MRDAFVLAAAAAATSTAALALADPDAVDATSDASAVRAAVAWVNGESVGVRTADGRHLSLRLPPAPNAESISLTWLAAGRSVAVERGKQLDVVDVPSRTVRTVAVPERRGVQFAYARDGTIAIAYGPATCGTADPGVLLVSVADPSGENRTLRTFPSTPPGGGTTLYWLTHLAWSSRGELSYVLHERRGSCNADSTRSTLVVTHPRSRDSPRALATFRPWSSFAVSTSWRPDGRHIAYAFSAGAKLVGAGDVATDGTSRRTVSLRRYANTVEIGWAGGLPLLLVNDDADVDTYRIDPGAHAARLLLSARSWGRNAPQALVAASRDGRYLSFATYAGLAVVDIRTRRRWVPGAYFVAATPDGRHVAIERGPLVQPAVRHGQIEVVDVRTRERRRVPTPPRYREIAVDLG